MVRLVVALIGLGVLLAPAPVAADINATRMAERYVAAVNTGNANLLDAIVAEDVVVNGDKLGRDAFKARLSDPEEPELFTELHLEIIAVIAEGEEVAVHLTLTATTGQSGEKVVTDLMMFWHVADGKITEITQVLDLAPLLPFM